MKLTPTLTLALALAAGVGAAAVAQTATTQTPTSTQPPAKLRSAAGDRGPDADKHRTDAAGRQRPASHPGGAGNILADGVDRGTNAQQRQ